MAQDVENNNGSPDVSTLLAGVLSNPEVMSKMSEIIARSTKEQNGVDPPQSDDNSPLDENVAESSGDNTDIQKDPSPTFQNLINPEVMSKLPDILSLLSSQKAPSSEQSRQQATLLLAIRPYLSERRRELIDTFIKLDRLGDILKKLT